MNKRIRQALDLRLRSARVTGPRENPLWTCGPDESEWERHALWQYCKLGPKRSLRRLSQVVARPSWQLKQSSVDYHWSLRAAAYDQQQLLQSLRAKRRPDPYGVRPRHREDPKRRAIYDGQNEVLDYVEAFLGAELQTTVIPTHIDRHGHAARTETIWPTYSVSQALTMLVVGVWLQRRAIDAGNAKCQTIAQREKVAATWEHIPRTLDAVFGKSRTGGLGQEDHWRRLSFPIVAGSALAEDKKLKSSLSPRGSRRPASPTSVSAARTRTAGGAGL